MFLQSLVVISWVNVVLLTAVALENAFPAMMTREQAVSLRLTLVHVKLQLEMTMSEQ